ncbi:MAG: polar amino acid transport system substrate-binding protein [Nocardioidaceae bacterium]|jgi:polar amino acid transport system substrate-binding protein|nr:polar amino acid transport system substrate-binding protein [Nocardioidaceae bacterium]
MRVGTKFAAAALGSVLLVSTAACGSDTSSSDGDGARKSSIDIATVKADPAVEKLVPADVKKRGSLTMAADLHYPPTSFLAEDNKTPVGYNVEIAQLLGKKMGLKVKIKNVSFDSVIPGIAAGRYDFTATNMTPTPDRLKVLDMVNYWNAGSSLVFSKGNPLKLSMTDETTLCGHKIAVMSGTTQAETYVPLISKECAAKGKKAVNAVVLPNVQGALTQLSSKRVDGVFYDTSALAWAAKQQPQAFELFPKQYVKTEGDDIVALGLAKDSLLTPALHAAMQSLIDGPEYKATLDKWGLGGGAIPTASVAK